MENAIVWHKAADGDFPDNCRYVWTNVGAGYHDDDGWWDDFGRLQNVIAWCEPKFEEQSYQEGAEFGYNKCDEQLTKAKKLIIRFIMGNVYFYGKETDLVEKAKQFLRELEE